MRMTCEGTFELWSRPSRDDNFSCSTCVVVVVEMLKYVVEGLSHHKDVGDNNNNNNNGKWMKRDNAGTLWSCWWRASRLNNFSSSLLTLSYDATR